MYNNNNNGNNFLTTVGYVTWINFTIACVGIWREQKRQNEIKNTDDENDQDIDKLLISGRKYMDGCQLYKKNEG